MKNSPTKIGKNVKSAAGIEINPKFIGALFTERADNLIRVFCFFNNGGTSQFDVPAHENTDNLQVLYTKMNMDETCASVILDEVVLGRVFVSEGENHWLYTLLASPGTVLPAFDANICKLPWRLCWQSQVADILEYGKEGDRVHCFAIRTSISENDAGRLLKDSKAFTSPVSILKKEPQRWIYLNIGVVIVALGILIGLTVYYTFKQYRIPKDTQPAVSAAAASPQSPAALLAGYYLLYQHQISGPYPMKVIADMNANGLLNPETMCRPENSVEWGSLTNLLSAHPAK